MHLHQAAFHAKLTITLFIAVTWIALSASGCLLVFSLGKSAAPSIPTYDRIRSLFCRSRLETAIKTNMACYITDPSEKRTLLEWCAAGGGRYGFYEKVEPVLHARCIACHGGEKTMASVSLRNWGDVSRLSTLRGPDFGVLLRRTHSHLFGLSLLALCSGLFLSFSRWPSKYRTAGVCLPFAALALDISSWWLARISDWAAPLIIVSGAALFASFFIVPAAGLYDMWRADPPS